MINEKKKERKIDLDFEKAAQKVRSSKRVTLFHIML